MTATRWSQRARADLKAIHDYIATDSPANAKAVVRDILARAAALPETPRIGRRVPELDDPEIREVPARSWRVILSHLTRAETAALNRSQVATGTQRHRDTRFPPFAFTEQPKYKHHDDAIAALLTAIRALMNPPAPNRRGIGFTADISDPK